MGLGRAFGEGLSTAKWLIQGYSILQSCSRKKHWYLWTCPFIEGTARMGSQLVMYPVSSHQRHHLLEVWNDAFDVTCQITPVAITQILIYKNPCFTGCLVVFRLTSTLLQLSQKTETLLLTTALLTSLWEYTNSKCFVFSSYFTFTNVFGNP